MRELYQKNEKEYRRRRSSYLLLYALPVWAIMNLLVPIAYRAGQLVLNAAGVPYISFNNLGEILNQPAAAIGTALILLLLLVAMHYQFVLFLVGIRRIRTDTDSLPEILRESASAFCRSLKGVWIWTVLYLVILLPFGILACRPAAYTKFFVPLFIWSSLRKTAMYLAALLLGYIVLTYIALERIYALPLAVLGGLSMHDAALHSREKVKGHRREIGKLLLYTGGRTAAGLVLINAGAVGLQFVSDLAGEPYSFASAVILMTIVQTGTLFLVGKNTLLLQLMLLPEECFAEERHAYGNRTEECFAEENKTKKTEKRRANVLFGIAALLLCVFTAPQSGSYLRGLDGGEEPLVIAHRGRNGQMFIQNSISALEYQARYVQPDYVEIDLHETKDLRFIVMHDENLRDLCGVNGAPHNYTLEQLTDMEATENGVSEKLAAFDEYLERADELGQPLIIEIKTTKYDSKDLAERFLAEYGDVIRENHHMIQSYDYDLIEEIEALAPDIFTSVIVPFNLFCPPTSADAYTVEEAMITSPFVRTALSEEKKVFVWTIDDLKTMEAMIFMGTGGIITDNSQQLKMTERSYGDESKYAYAMLLYIRNFKIRRLGD